MRRTFRRRFRRKHHWQWIRNTSNNASPNSTLDNVDLLSNFRTQLGISVNLPEITIWRIHLKISIVITVNNPLISADGVLLTVFVDGQNQTLLNQSTNPYDQRDLMYDYLYASQTVQQSSGNLGTQNYVLYKEYDIKSHRKLVSLDDTLFLQLAASGNASIDSYSWSQSVLLKIGS